jgi:beta-glucosidase
VSIPIDARSLSYYAPAKASWIVDAGSYAIRVGPSSATLPLVKNLTAPALTLPTNTSNPLPQPIRESVQVSADQAY